MPKRLHDKVALVIGAGSIGPGWGNGKAAAVLFAREGASILAADLNRDAAEETARLIREEGGRCAVAQADAANPAQVEAMIKTCIGLYGHIDILHNNVGIAELGGPVDTSLESWDRVHDVNLKSAFLSCKYTIPYMQKQGGGAIINISSIAGIRWTGIDYIAYSSSKAALIHFSKMLAYKYAPNHIRCNAILPGLMRTPLVETSLQEAYEGDIEAILRQRDALCPMGHMGDAWDIAQAALFLASDEANYITGVALPVDGGVSLRC